MNAIRRNTNTQVFQVEVDTGSNTPLDNNLNDVNFLDTPTNNIITLNNLIKRISHLGNSHITAVYSRKLQVTTDQTTLVVYHNLHSQIQVKRISTGKWSYLGAEEKLPWCCGFGMS